MMDTLLNVSVNCLTILMYALTGITILTMARMVIKKIISDVMEHRRNIEQVTKTEHVYHAS